MTIREPRPAATENAMKRSLTCGHCGTSFGCTLNGDCWCAHEAVRLPMPAAGADCLCPGCLRAAARAHEAGETPT